MAGFPAKITRDSLGPTFEDEVKVANPARELSAGTVNLMAWQVAGLNGPAARGLVRCTVVAGVVAVASQWFAWDPNQALANMSWARSSAGVYTWSLPNAGFGVGVYLDKDANQVPAGLIAAVPAVQGTANLLAIAAVNGNGNSGTMNVFTANSAAATDPSGFVVWFI